MCNRAEEDEERLAAAHNQLEQQFTSGFVCESPRHVLSHAQMFTSKLGVSAICRAFQFLNWGEGASFYLETLPPLFSATTTTFDMNGTAYESL